MVPVPYRYPPVQGLKCHYPVRIETGTQNGEKRTGSCVVCKTHACDTRCTVNQTTFAPTFSMFRIRIGVNGDPGPAFHLNADPDPRSQTNADPCDDVDLDPDPGQTLPSQKVEF
jgi:hypothetical protein